MIQSVSKNTDEKNYRAIMMDSSSSLKVFSENRRKYYKKYYLNESVEEKDNQAITMGKVVELLLLEPHLFDDKFYLSACATGPTGLMLEFVEGLYRANKEATDEDGNITKSFEEMSKEAYISSGFKIKYEAVIGKFVGSDAEIFYNEIRQVRAKNLTVVTIQDITNAEKIVEELKTNSITSKIVNLTRSTKFDIFNQFQIEGYTVDFHLFKSMIDKIIVNHEEKTISIYDLKCTWSVENFYTEYYLYRRAYIQAYLYFKAIHSLTENPENEWFGYEVLPTKFIVCDSINYYSPLIYTLTARDLADAYVGFNYRDKDYPGVSQIIQDLSWAINNDIWNISRKNYLSNGIVNIKG